MAASHGTRSRYNAGCKCDACRKAENDYRKRRRRSKRAEERGVKLVVTPQADDREAVPEPERKLPASAGTGSVERALMEQVEGLAGAEDRPGEVAVVRALGRILDDPLAISQHPAASARVLDYMAKLERGGKKRRGKLAAVRDMTAG